MWFAFRPSAIPEFPVIGHVVFLVDEDFHLRERYKPNDAIVQEDSGVVEGMIKRVINESGPT